MALDPQYTGSGGGLYPASSTSQIPGPVGANRIEGVPAPASVGFDVNSQLRTPGLGTLVQSSSQNSDTLPIVNRTVTATGAVTQAPAVVDSIRCIAGTAVTLVLRDSVQQNLADTDTTSVQIQSLTMNAGDVVSGPFEFAFGVHATLGGTSPSFEVRF